MKSSVLALLLLLPVGCIGPRSGCRIAAANITAAPIASVVIEDEGGKVFAFENLGPNVTSTYQSAGHGLSRTLRLVITAPNGTRHESTVDLGKPVPAGFNARVVFQLEDEQRVRAFVLPGEDGSDKSDMPWAIPPSWQGTVSLPGLSQE